MSKMSFPDRSLSATLGECVYCKISAQKILDGNDIVMTAGRATKTQSGVDAIQSYCCEDKCCSALFGNIFADTNIAKTLMKHVFSPFRKNM